MYSCVFARQAIAQWVVTSGLELSADTHRSTTALRMNNEQGFKV